MWRTIQSMLRIMIGRTTEHLPDAAAHALLRTVERTIGDGTLDLPKLRARMEQTATAVERAFRSVVGEIV